jgi:hypothetical protein
MERWECWAIHDFIKETEGPYTLAKFAEWHEDNWPAYGTTTRGQDVRESMARSLMKSLGVGDRVKIRDGHWWPEEGETIHYYPGTVTKITTRGIQVKWDDRDEPRLVKGEDIAWMRPLKEQDAA